MKIERDEKEKREKKQGKRKDFLNKDGKLDKRQYLADLYKLIKDNMDEVKRMIDAHNNKSNLIKLLKDKTSLMNELGEGGKNTVDDLKRQLKVLLEQLRFPDGSTLKDLVEQKKLHKEFQQKLNKEEGDDNENGEKDEELDLENLDRHTESGVPESESQIDESEMDDDSFAQAIANNLDHEMFPEENDDHQNDKDQHQKELDVERQVRLKREHERRKNDFKDKIGDLYGDNIGDIGKDGIMDGFDEKMRSLEQLMQAENER